MASDTVSVQFKGGTSRGVGFTGGGGVAQPWTPCVSGAGATFTVHFYDQQHGWIKTVAYILSSTLTGVYGLTNPSSFFADIPAGCEAFIGVCSGAAISLGAGGSSNVADANYLKPGATTEWTLEPGDALHWCCMPGSNGWKIERDESGAGSESATISNVFGRQASTNALTGTAWTKFTASGNSRSGVSIYNPDLSLSLWARVVIKGASPPAAPTGIATDPDFAIAPGNTVVYAFEDTLDIYICNSSGLGTTSGYVMSEFAI